MAKEILAIPEEHLEDFLEVLAAGLKIVASKSTVMASENLLVEITHLYGGTTTSERPRIKPESAQALRSWAYEMRDHLDDSGLQTDETSTGKPS